MFMPGAAMSGLAIASGPPNSPTPRGLGSGTWHEKQASGPPVPSASYAATVIALRVEASDDRVEAIQSAGRFTERLTSCADATAPGNGRMAASFPPCDAI